MKKIFIALAAALTIGAFSSCQKVETPKDDNYKQLGDSLALLNGQFMGSSLKEYMSQDTVFAANFNEQKFLKGLKASLFADTVGESYIVGQNAGMNLLGQIMQIERTSGIRIDRQKVYDALVAALKGDSVPDQMALRMTMAGLQGQVAEAQKEYRLEQVMAQPEVQSIMKTGEIYINDQKKADPNIKTTESGLAYKVIEEGEGELIGENDRVLVNYVGKHTNGEEFDNSNGSPRSFSPKQVVPGFGEGLQLMKKGGKYVLYIPGKLGYGADGQPRAGIQPMETLIFEVEVVDVNPAATPAIQLQAPSQQVK